jgi:hypothetical protein
MMIQHTQVPSLCALHLLANRPEYALTLEEHSSDDGSEARHAVVCLHGDFEALSANAVATLAVELFVLRRCFPGLLFTIERTPDDEKYRSFMGLFGFQPQALLPCEDGQMRLMLASSPSSAGVQV